MTGEEMRFLRSHIGWSGERLGQYLHTDRTKVSKWERGEDQIGPSTDRLMRLLITVLDEQLLPSAPMVGQHLREITDERGELQQIYIDVKSGEASYLKVSAAA